MAGGWGKAPQPPARSVGSFLGVKAKPLRAKSCASLDPHPPGSAPPPLRGPLARFSSRGRVKGVGAARSPAGARTRPLDATGATQACRQGVGALFPGTPALGERPRQAAGGACKACGAGGHPLPGFQGARSPLGLAQRTKPSAEGRHFLLFELRFWVFAGPKRGLIYRYRRGRGES